jgi:dTDP-4-dehydrorhamnose reductase
MITGARGQLGRALTQVLADHAPIALEADLNPRIGT